MFVVARLPSSGVVLFFIFTPRSGGFFIGEIMQYSKNITESIGNTPLIQLQKVVRGVYCNVLVKVEYMNPGGSVKDRLAMQIITDAEEKGLLKKG